MQIDPEILAIADEMAEWRRDFHTHPETAFEEVRTSEIVAQKLSTWGIEVHRGLAKTGVVGKLVGSRPGNRAIALRADMDALDILEANDIPYRSKTEGKMHACGHDGHTTMLLGAAKRLAANPDFAGTAYFVFQPAEENEAGGQVMVQDGLFDLFPAESVYGMHNMPGIPVGKIGMRSGPAMASCDLFEVIVTGKGAHAAMPHRGFDTIQATAQIVTALQTVVSRRVSPLQPMVLSITQVHAGEAWNVLPDRAVIRGTVRAFSSQVQDQAEQEIRLISENIAASVQAGVTIDYQRRYPVLVNNENETAFCAKVAGDLVGDNNIDVNAAALMGSEDFSYMLNERPGCYIWMGNGAEGEKGSVPVHNSRYDFNDDISVIGASYWVKLVQTALH